MERDIGRMVTYLEPHELHELVDMWREDFDGLFVDVNSVCLVVALDLRQGTRTASPSVEHDGMGVAFLEQLVLER